MRSRTIHIAPIALFTLVAAVGARAAWAQAIGGAANLATGPTTSSTAATSATPSTASTALPPPPPSSITNSASSTSGVPPTPAPASPGLPSAPTTGALPSQQGLGAQVTNELRPSPSLNAAQVANVQAALAAGGLYRGPIDGNMTGAVRASIRLYQQIQGLPQTGDLDAETAARLQSGSLGSNGATSTVGNRAAAGDPFSTSTTQTSVPTTTTTTRTGGSTTAAAPFSISTPLNTSPAGAPPGITVQP
jgi:hypothetical protein